MIKIGVFDSGVGGQSVINAIKADIHDAEFVYVTDRENLPYGGKSRQRLLELAIPKIKRLEASGCQVAVIACNTVCTNIIKEVRSSLNIPVIAVEPMVKPACQLTKSKKIIVCATPATLKSQRYQELVSEYAEGVKVLEPNCGDWTSLIERKMHNIENIKADIVPFLKTGADVIVLACTHYHWIEEEIIQIAEAYNAVVLQPEQAIIKQLKRVIGRL